MKIAVIFTGGTIGSRLQDGWISANRETKFQLVENYKKNHQNEVEFLCSEPYFILSENLSARELNLLITAFKEAENSDADGIIITHGTDSLQFSAAALCLVSSFAKPTLLVSANRPLDDPAGNGNENFAAAVDFISQNCGNGVYISYKNPKGEHCFHRGDKAVAFLEGDDSLFSLNHKPYALWKNGKIEVLESPSPLLSAKACRLTEKPKILCIGAMPSDCFEYDLKGVNAVLLRPYHSGTLNTASPDFIRFLGRARDEKIPVFLANAPMGETYESAKLYEELGIVPLCGVTFATAYMRLWFGISGGEKLLNLF